MVVVVVVVVASVVWIFFALVVAISRPPSPRLVVDRWNEPSSNPVDSEPGEVCLCDSLARSLTFSLSLFLGEEGLQRWEEESERVRRPQHRQIIARTLTTSKPHGLHIQYSAATPCQSRMASF